MIRKTFIAATVLLIATAAHAQTWKCSISEKSACIQGNGCKPNHITITNRIDFDRKTFSRCDVKGCDSYAADFTASGMFINIDVPGRGMFAKAALDGSSFVEVVTLGTNALVSHGVCLNATD